MRQLTWRGLWLIGPGAVAAILILSVICALDSSCGWAASLWRWLTKDESGSTTIRKSQRIERNMGSMTIGANPAWKSTAGGQHGNDDAVPSMGPDRPPAVIGATLSGRRGRMAGLVILAFGVRLPALRPKSNTQYSSRSGSNHCGPPASAMRPNPQFRGLHGTSAHRALAIGTRVARTAERYALEASLRVPPCGCRQAKMGTPWPSSPSLVAAF